MPKKYFNVDDIGAVCVTKRRRSRRLRLRIASDGQVHVSIPYWVPYRSALSFVGEKRQWIAAHQPSATVINEGDMIGKHHRVIVRRIGRNEVSRTRVSDSEILLTMPENGDVAAVDSQVALEKAAKRALVRQASRLLPVRVETLAKDHGFSYRSLRFRAMKSRWGSCSSQRDITLNVYLLQLDDRLIDYVILHELLHTEIVSHGQVFWHRLAEHVDDLPAIRRQMRQLEPRILPQRG